MNKVTWEKWLVLNMLGLFGIGDRKIEVRIQSKWFSRVEAFWGLGASISLSLSPSWSWRENET